MSINIFEIKKYYVKLLNNSADIWYKAQKQAAHGSKKPPALGKARGIIFLFEFLRRSG